MIFDVTFEESKQTFNIAFKEVEIIDNTRPVVIEPLEIVENGEYHAETIDGFNPVKVNVPLKYDEGYQNGYADCLEEMDLQDKLVLNTKEMTDFRYFCIGNRFINRLNEIHTENGKDFSYMFFACTTLESILHFDTSNGTSFEGMFQSCAKLQTIPKLNVGKGTNFSYMFQSCGKLQTIPQLDIRNGTRFDYVFGNCKALETVSITTAKSNLFGSTFQGCTTLKNLTIGEGWNVNIYVHYSNELTVESLHGMIENLADLTGKTAKTFQIGSTNLAKIDAEHLTMLQNKNWNYS